MKMPRFHPSLFLAIPIAPGFADRALKVLVTDHFANSAFTLIPNVLELTHFANTGIAFSIPFSGYALWMLSAMFIVGFGIFAFRYAKNTRIPPGSAYLIFVIGATSNLYDRIAFGHTIDYFLFFGRSAVNLADGMIILGVALLVWRTKKKAPGPSPANHSSA